MVYQLFQNFANIEKFQNTEEEVIEYYQENNGENGTEEEVIEYQTTIPDKLSALQEEVENLVKNIDSSTDPNAEVLLNELSISIKVLITKIEDKELSKKKIEEGLLQIESLYDTVSGKETFNGEGDDRGDDDVDDEGNDDEEADDEGNDEEGSDSNENDNFVDTDDNSEVVEGFQGNNNNIIEYNTGMGKILSIDLLLRSVLYACLFFILAHPDTLKMVGKLLKGVSKANLLYVHMLVFAVVYYVLNLFI
jgi:hypothetical protein